MVASIASLDITIRLYIIIFPFILSIFQYIIPISKTLLIQWLQGDPRKRGLKITPAPNGEFVISSHCSDLYFIVLKVINYQRMDVSFVAMLFHEMGWLKFYDWVSNWGKILRIRHFVNCQYFLSWNIYFSSFIVLTAYILTYQVYNYVTWNYGKKTVCALNKNEYKVLRDQKYFLNVLLFWHLVALFSMQRR